MFEKAQSPWRLRPMALTSKPIVRPSLARDSLLLCYFDLVLARETTSISGNMSAMKR